MLDVTDRLCVVIGGGGVAVRKVEGLIAAGATRIRCVSPTFDSRMPQSAQRIEAAYEAAHLDGAKLVFATTDRADVNEAVVRDARERGIFVNRADVDEDAPSDFSTPAALRDGVVTITVSAGGSAALAAAIRDHVAQHMDARLIEMAMAMRTLRPAIRSSGLDVARRKAIFRDLVTPAAMDALASGGEASLRAWLVQRYPELTTALG